jgi:hypothetical protein
VKVRVNVSGVMLREIVKHVKVKASKKMEVNVVIVKELVNVDPVKDLENAGGVKEGVTKIIYYFQSLNLNL